MPVVEDVYFQITTPLGVKVRTTKTYWLRIVETKHPIMRKFENEAKQALEKPDQIRRSLQDPKVHLYYKIIGNLSVCVVVDHLTEKDGYIITAYLTDRIKEGEEIYVKN